jgi:F0F1-type ATP synthase delta subunit
LSEDQIKELEDSFKVRGRNVELTQKLDESLISGFKIVLEDEVVDASMKSKIARMKNELLKERM